MPRSYPPAFRHQALALLAAGRTVSDVAAPLGVAQSRGHLPRAAWGELHRWRKQDLIDRGQADGASSQASAELTGAKKRIRDLEEEVKILRRAAAAVQEVVPPEVRFRLVAQLHVDGVRIGRSCHALGVFRSGYLSKPGSDGDLGVRHDEQVQPGVRMVEVVPPGSQVGLVLQPASSALPMAVRLGTLDADTAHARLAHTPGVVLHNEAVLRRQGVPAVFHFSDPDGNDLVHLQDP
ncbi:transposase [Kineococcus sp. SYSU DK005]|uniref:transposase n=1 Tax=Kineococcus sp. SYSU DK005 TaxID=3383126 RepID=UPI003D7C5576